MAQNPSEVKGFDISFFLFYYTVPLPQRKVYHPSVRSIILLIVITVILVVGRKIEWFGLGLDTHDNI